MKKPCQHVVPDVPKNGSETAFRTERGTFEPFVNAESAGDFLQLQPRRVLQLARQGRLPAYPIGDGPRKVWRFRLSELAAAMLHSRQRSHVPEEI
jgi:hypothetical protein